MSPVRRRADCELLLEGFLREEMTFPELARLCGIRAGQVGRELARCLGGLLEVPSGAGHPRVDEVVLYWSGRSDLASRRRREVAAHLASCRECWEARREVLRLLDDHEPTA